MQLRTQKSWCTGTPVSARQVARLSQRSSVIVRAGKDIKEVTKDVRKIIAEQLGTEEDKVQADSNFADLGADSLDTVEIMMALEEKFDIQLDEEEAQKLTTVQQAADKIASMAN